MFICTYNIIYINIKNHICGQYIYKTNIYVCITYISKIDRRGDPKMEFIYKKLCSLTCLNFSRLPSSLHLMQYT